MAEDLVPVPAAGADVPAHVLDQSKRCDVQLPEHLQRFHGDVRGHVLRSADDGDTGQRNGLRQRQRGVARARRQVDDEVVELAPIDLDHHRLDRLADHRPAIDRRLLAGIDVAERHELQPVGLDGAEAAIDLFRHLFGAGHGGHRRSVDIRVEQSDRRAALAQGGREVDSDGRLADPALAGGDGNRLLHTGKDFGRLWPHERGSHVGRHPHVDARHAW